MPHIIEEAKSGRAGCRTCRKPIAKGELRFGEEVENQFADAGETTHRWHHMACAAGSKTAKKFGSSCAQSTLRIEVTRAGTITPCTSQSILEPSPTPSSAATS